MIVLIPTTKERRNKLDLLIPRIRESAGMKHLIVIYENNDGGCAIAQLNALKSLTDDHIVVLNDDMWPVTENWLKLLYDKFMELFPDGNGIVQPADGLSGGKIATIPFTTIDFYKKYFPTEFFHNYSDTVFSKRARGMGLYKYYPKVYIAHNHPTNKSEFDETYKISNSTYKLDREQYLKMFNNVVV